LCGEAFEHGRGACLIRDSLRQFDEESGLDIALFGVGAGRGDIDDPFADLEVLDALAEFGDFAGPFAARREWPLRRLNPLSIVDIEIVDADSMVTHPRFSRPGRGQLDLLQP
jgi:hypothetical protein